MTFAPPPHEPSAGAPLTLTSLPLFPLGTVLFPGGQLALRVFEVRYLDMVRKCRLAGAPFGVVALTDGHEVRQAGAAPEKFHDVGTLAAISDLDTSHPGLIALRAEGSERFRIVRRQLLPHGLWIADVEQLPPDVAVPVPQDLRKAAQALEQVLGRLHDRSPDDTSVPVPTAAQLDDCGWVANRWCELLPVPIELKQQLMQLDSPLLRLELVGDVLERTGIAG
ncbi:LON peptidase substrate-binding domain-containing protein [Acidovorax sp. GBBC 3334]|uniref:LON peptidase substrate-binding domain-containing protein n=1 Tax=Acidovorax sp. GBBC 3334 TaxID=2940496 RepID=UPI0023023A2C|nr:LON peptidase substrate-binding domain-containing protein [Acidovorax sp. GBBC 3334]MDA8454603.1 LON peptidase substrate-binding domain-containing protein [Acidovorax sp. GBBC 3334]